MRFLSGEIGPKTLFLTLKEDQVAYEQNETFTLSITSLNKTQFPTDALFVDVLNCTILDEDG